MPTFQSRSRWSAKRKETISNALKRSWSPGGAHHERFLNRPADADTMRKRELWDRKGITIGAFGFSTGAAYVVRHSPRRTDSFDVLLAGKLVCSGGKAKVGLFLGSLLP